MTEFIFADIDNTVLDFSKSEKNAIKETLLSMNILADDGVAELYSQINDEMWKLLEKKKITRAELNVKRFAKLFARLNINNTDPAETHKRYAEILSHQVFFVDGAEEMLKNLSKKYRMFAASNGNAYVQHGRIKRSGIDKYFENIFISQEIGYNKPDKAFFEKCFSQISGFDKNKAIILGDSLSSDILGGKNAGIKTCWFSPNGESDDKIKPDFTVKTLAEFEILIKEI